jgi:hypothetical protein
VPIGGSALILFAMLAQFSVWPVYQLQRSEARKEMKHRLLAEVPVSELSVLRFTQEQFASAKFEDGGKEVWVDSSLYDVVRVEHRSNGCVTLFALRDDGETHVLAALEHLLREVEHNERAGKERRVSMVASWASYCEQVPAIVFCAVCADRGFPALVVGGGRIVDPLEPAPPKSA